MTQLNGDMKLVQKASSQALAQVGRFMGKIRESEKSNSGLALFDSIEDQHIPQCLKNIFDGIGDTPKNRAHIMQGINIGRAAYREKSGGQEPTDAMIACAISAGAALHYRGVEGTSKSEFDSVSGAVVGESDKFDNFNVDHHEAISIVPAMTVVTIATALANSLPIVAMLPNPIGSNEVPLVYARMTAGSTMGGFTQGDFLDGDKASRAYLENRFRFAMALDTGTTYKVTPRVHYLDYAAKTPDTGTPVAPFQGGRVVIKVNGVEVANDRSRDNTKKSGSTAMTAITGVVIAATPVLVTSGSANLDTHLITVVFSAALPVGAIVTAHVIFDYERKDPTTKQLILHPPTVDMALEYDSVLAGASRTSLEASIDSITQMQNELGVGFLPAALALVQNKFYFEQTLRLLDEAKERAENNGRTATFDMSRGVSGDLAAGFNTTAELMGEVSKTIAAAMLDINQTTGASASAFDLFVSNKGAVFFDSMNADHFDRANTNFASHTQIVRIGSLKNGVNVYHIPTSTGLLTDATGASEMLLVARSAEAAKSTFVGHMPVPPMVTTAQPSEFTTNIGVYARVAADMNPISRFADQACLIAITNMPSI